ncbi:MAG: hypothetical protein WCL00_01060 [Bacteroidota bacterium]
MKSYHRFLYIFFILALTTILVDQIIGIVIQRLYFKQQSGPLYRTTYAMDSTNAQIIVLGTSRANHHYIPEIFEHKLKLTCYNAGRDGTSIFYHYAVLKCILLRYKPRIILLEMDAQDLIFRTEDIERVSALFPYYDKHPQIRSTIEMQGGLIPLKMLSRIYQSNTDLLNILIGNMDFNKLRKKDFKGYIQVIDGMKDSIIENRPKPMGYPDPIKVAFLDSVIDLCRANNIRLQVITSPIFGKSVNQKSNSALKNFLTYKGIEYWEYENDKAFISQHHLFHDMIHLNDEGARKFSEIVSNRLKN